MRRHAILVSMTSRTIALIVTVLAAAGCALSIPYELYEQEVAAAPAGEFAAGPSPAGERVARSARAFVGRTRLRVAGRTYNLDCSGTILAIYHDAGIDLLPQFQRQSGNGVRRLYGIARDHSLLYEPKLPRPGDVIFWDNTYDRNGDRLWNDELTHAGIVISAGPDGQVEYVHHNYSRGIVVERMNLYDPDAHTQGSVLVNSPMRMKSHRHLNPREWLASHLYRGAGMLHRL